MSHDLSALGEALFRSVWRLTRDLPGFAVVLLEPGVPSAELRRLMVGLVEAMGDAAVAVGQPRFGYERLGRFDQQVTTKFHRDGGPDASLLVLGYEPSSVASRLFVADLPRAAANLGIGCNEFIARHNPMLPDGEVRLRPFVTELAWPKDRPAVVVLNNCLFPDARAAGQPLGVLHKGEIPQPDPAARRVINSLGLTPAPGAAVKGPEAVEHFLTRDDLD